MSRLLRFLLIGIAAFALFSWWPGQQPLDAGSAGSGQADSTPTAGYPAFLPSEAIDTLQLIERGGPFPFSRDGVVFQNRERLLPNRPTGYYREYTVRTPGERDRGARRIVAGGQPPEVYYYSDDHYRSFREVEIER
jgi:guanyl-specific ribonuclease Sa